MSCWVFYTDKYTIQAFSFPHIRTAHYAFCNPSCLACFSCSCSYDCSYSGFQPRLDRGSQAGCRPRLVGRGPQAGCQSSLECGSRWCCLMSRACNPKAWIIQQILSTGLLFFPPGDDLLICPWLLYSKYLHTELVLVRPTNLIQSVLCVIKPDTFPVNRMILLLVGHRHSVSTTLGHCLLSWLLEWWNCSAIFSRQVEASLSLLKWSMKLPVAKYHLP